MESLKKFLHPRTLLFKFRMFKAPKFDQSSFAKFDSSDIKESARSFSVNTLRSSMDESLERNSQDFDDT